MAWVKTVDGYYTNLENGNTISYHGALVGSDIVYSLQAGNQLIDNTNAVFTSTADASDAIRQLVGGIHVSDLL